MREIKFRIWDCDNELMSSHGLSFDNIEDFRHALDSFEDYFGRSYLKDNPNYLMQFTGLQDKNGVDIYEGDKVIIEILNEDSCMGESDAYEGIVIYGNNYKSVGKNYVTEYPCSFTIFCKKWYKEEGLLGNKNHIIEVIGNIHEN